MKTIGNRTIKFDKDLYISSYAAVVGPKEAEGPIGSEFDRCFDDSILGQDSWEQAESVLQKASVSHALLKGNFKPEEIDVIFAGDLLNQCIASSFGLMNFDIPLVGVYGACSTMALSLINAAVYVASGAAEKAVAVTSSHFCSAERQYRFPLEYGGVRPPTSQWTVTGSGAVVVTKEKGISIDSFIVGKIVDMGIKDANNMGAAMAPAAVDTIMTYLKDTGTSPGDYDMIYTGDLGSVGTELLYELADKENIKLRGHHKDCGNIIYDATIQDVHAGGSGCGCSASVLCSHILNKMSEGELNNILFCATGALMSPTSSMQGESIPSIAHLINLRTSQTVDIM